MEQTTIIKTKSKIRNNYVPICQKQFEYLKIEFDFISDYEVDSSDFKMTKDNLLLLKNKKPINLFNYNNYINIKNKKK